MYVEASDCTRHSLLCMHDSQQKHCQWHITALTIPTAWSCWAAAHQNQVQMVRLADMRSKCIEPMPHCSLCCACSWLWWHWRHRRPDHSQQCTCDCGPGVLHLSWARRGSWQGPEFWGHWGHRGNWPLHCQRRIRCVAGFPNSWVYPATTDMVE